MTNCREGAHGPCRRRPRLCRAAAGRGRPCYILETTSVRYLTNATHHPTTGAHFAARIHDRTRCPRKACDDVQQPHRNASNARLMHCCVRFSTRRPPSPSLFRRPSGATSPHPGPLPKGRGLRRPALTLTLSQRARGQEKTGPHPGPLPAGEGTGQPSLFDDHERPARGGNPGEEERRLLAGQRVDGPRQTLVSLCIRSTTRRKSAWTRSLLRSDCGLGNS